MDRSSLTHTARKRRYSFFPESPGLKRVHDGQPYHHRHADIHTADQKQLSSLFSRDREFQDPGKDGEEDQRNRKRLQETNYQHSKRPEFRDSYVEENRSFAENDADCAAGDESRHDLQVKRDTAFFNGDRARRGSRGWNFHFDLSA